MALPSCGNRMSSHRIHTYCVYSPTDFHSSGGILPPPQQRVSHRIRRSHRSLCWEYSPTDFTDLHRWLGCVDSSGGILASAAAKCLPQISLLLRIFSHRFHRIHRNSCWGDSPTDFTDQHRWLGCVYSPTDFTEFTEVRVHPLKLAASEFRGASSHLCYSCYSCSFLPKQVVLWILWNPWENLRTQRICVNPCNLWEDIPSRRFCEFCVICGRIFRT